MLTYTKDMIEIKEEVLKKFKILISNNLEKYKNTQKKYIKNLYSKEKLLYYLIPFLFPALVIFAELFTNSKNSDYWCLFIPFGLMEIAILAINIHFTNKNYQNWKKESLFKKIVKLFDENIKYSAGSEQNTSLCIPESEIANSKLYNHGIDIDFYSYDDRFGGKYKDVQFKINEILFGASKGRKYPLIIFSGLALYFKLFKTINNRVLITSKHSFFKVPRGYEKVNVEYTKFSKKYDVYVEKNNNSTSAQIEARYLLNTAFLDRFMQIQTSFKIDNIRCSIFGNKLLMMLSTGQDLFEMNNLFRRIDDINQYEQLFNEFASIFSFIDVLNLSSKTKL